jgi:hypothetical protein
MTWLHIGALKVDEVAKLHNEKGRNILRVKGRDELA